MSRGRAKASSRDHFRLTQRDEKREETQTYQRRDFEMEYSPVSSKACVTAVSDGRDRVHLKQPPTGASMVQVLQANEKACFHLAAGHVMKSSCEVSGPARYAESPGMSKWYGISMARMYFASAHAVTIE
jgi:hypothetical protein